MSEIEVTRNDAESRFEAHRDDELLGYIDYYVNDSVITLPHTLVFPQYEGQGVGSALARQTLDQIREMGDLKVQPSCPFVGTWIKRHPDYQDLVAE